MRDIVVTTPKEHMEIAALEAKHIIAAGGGYYFRNLGMRPPKELKVGGRCFYVEDDFVRGYATVTNITDEPNMVCQTSGREFGPGVYAFMDAETWTWIKPLPQQGFEGWQYANILEADILVLGGWTDPRPAL